MDINNVTKGFEAVRDRMDAIEQEHDTLLNQIKSVRDLAKSMYGQNALRREAQGDGERFFGDDETAKGFFHTLVKMSKMPPYQPGVIITKDLEETSGDAGGYLVPDEYRATIVEQMGTFGLFRNNTTIVPMQGKIMRVPKVTEDLTVYSPGAGNAITPSQMAFGQLLLNVKKLAALVAVDRELEDDAAIVVGNLLGRSIARSFAKAEDSCAFAGDGSENYWNFIGIPAALRAVADDVSTIAGLVVGSGNTYAELTLGDFDEVVGRLPEEFSAGASWYMSKLFYHKVVYPLARSTAHASIFEILSDKKTKSFLGYPIQFTGFMPRTEANSQVCAILGDLRSGSFLGQTKQLAIDRSENYLFGSDQVALRAIERIDLNIYGVGDTNNAGPIVGLITAAS